MRKISRFLSLQQVSGGVCGFGAFCKRHLTYAIFCSQQQAKQDAAVQQNIFQVQELLKQ
jgi:hypothetical protein